MWKHALVRFVGTPAHWTVAGRGPIPWGRVAVEAALIAALMLTGSLLVRH